MEALPSNWNCFFLLHTYTTHYIPIIPDTLCRFSRFTAVNIKKASPWDADLTGSVASSVDAIYSN